MIDGHFGTADAVIEMCDEPEFQGKRLCGARQT